MFKALMLEKDDAGFRAVAARASTRPALPEGDVTGRGRVLDPQLQGRARDHQPQPDRAHAGRWSPGIDGAGTVLESSHPRWKAGDAVVHNGWGVGETRWGCLAERARLKGDWLVALPAAFSARQAMAIGTAGYTAMLCVLALERHGVQAGRRQACSSPARPAASAASPSRARARSAIASTAATGKAAGGGLPARARRRARSIDRAELARAGQAAAEGALGGGDRRRRQPHARQRAGADALRRRRRRLRPGAGARPAGDGDALHPARRHAGRHRQRDGAARRCARRPGAAWPAISTRPRSTSITEEVAARRDAIAKAEALLAGGVRGRVVGRGSERRDRRGLSGSAASRRLNFGCWLVPSHSKITISVVTTSAPSARARSVAARRSCGWREPTASATHFTAWPASSRPATVCSTQTCASQPATTSVLRPAGRRRRKPSSAAAEKWNLASVVSHRAAISATERAEPVGVLLGADDVDAELARRGGELDAAANDRLAVVDRRHQAGLRVDDQKRAVVGLAEDGHREDPKLRVRAFSANCGASAQ